MRKMGAKWLIREEALEPNETLDREFEAINRRCGEGVRCEAKRLTFFGDIAESKLRTKKASNAILAYVVIVKIHFPNERSPKPKNRTYIFEAVVRFPSIASSKETPYKDNLPEPTIRASIFNCLRSFSAWCLQTFGLRSRRVPITNYYYHCGNIFETAIGTKLNHSHYTIPGIYFAQQNDLTSVCAHVAIQMAVNNAPVLGQEKLTSEKMNSLLNIDHRTPRTRVGHFILDTHNEGEEKRGSGLSTPEIRTIAANLGFDTLFADFLQPKMVECYKWVYPHLESCFPTILGIQREGNEEQKVEELRHVIVILGHTMNTDRWEPEARTEYKEIAVSPYHSTCDWMDHFLINDDNFGMARSLSTDRLKDARYLKKQGRIHPSMAISLVPKGIRSTGINAELLASVIIHDLASAMRKSGKLLKWQRVLTRMKPTCRTFASTTESYLNHLSMCEDNFGNKVSSELLKAIESNVSGLLWITEISVPDLFCGNKAKLGDVVCRTDFEYTGVTPNDLEAVKFLWLPGFAIISLTTPKVMEWPITGYVHLQRPPHPMYPIAEW